MYGHIITAGSGNRKHIFCAYLFNSLTFLIIYLRKYIVQSQNSCCPLKIQWLARGRVQELMTPEGVCSKSGYAPEAAQVSSLTELPPELQLVLGISESKEQPKKCQERRSTISTDRKRQIQERKQRNWGVKFCLWWKKNWMVKSCGTA